MAGTRKIGSEKLRALIYYTLVIVILYAPVVLTGKSLQPPLYQPHGIMAGYPYGYDGRVPVNTFNVDLATPSYYEWPVNRLVGSIYSSGSLPLWNPYQAAGTPLAADYSTRAFFPYQILEDMSPPWMWDFFLLGRVLTAAFFSLLFLRLLCLSFPSAFLGGLFYSLSGTMVWFINLEQMVNVAMMIPVLLYSVERLISRWSSTSIAFVGIATAMVITGGQPEVALYALLLGASYSIFRVINLRGECRPFRALVSLTSALVLGLALSAPLILPFLDYKESGYTHHGDGEGIGREHISNPRMIFNIFVPGASIIPAHPDIVPEALASFTGEGGESEYFRMIATKGLWDYVGGSTGVVAPLCALGGFIYLILTYLYRARPGNGDGKADEKAHIRTAGLVSWEEPDGPLRRSLPLLIFFLTFGLFILLKNYGVWPFIILGDLPLFELVWSPRWSGPSWVFSVAMAGAIGAEVLKSRHISFCSETYSGGEVGFKAADRSAGSPPGYGSLANPHRATLIIILTLAALYLISEMPGVLLLSADAERHFSSEVAPFIGPSILGSHIIMIVTLIFAIFLVFGGRGGRVKGEAPLALSLIILAVAEFWWSVPRGYNADTLLEKPFVYALFIVAVLFTMRGCYRSAVTFVIFSLISFLIIDGRAERGMPERHDPFAQPPHVEFLKSLEGEYRITGTEGAWYPNYASTAGLHDIRHINALLVPDFRNYRKHYLEMRLPKEGKGESYLWFTGRSERVVVAHDEGAGSHFKVERSDVFRNIKERLPYYSLLSVRYIVAPKGVDGSELGMPLIYDKEVKIYENTAALPRAFVSHGYKRYSSVDEAALKGSYNQVALVDEVPPGFAPEAGGGDGGVPLGARIIEDDPNRVIVEATLEGAGILVLTDTLYRGWRARSLKVDGGGPDRSAPDKDWVTRNIYLANGLVRGVFLEEGTYLVEFNYMPNSFRLGGLLFLLGLLISIILLLPFWRFRTNRG